MNGMSHGQRAYVEYVRRHPGCCAADVDRACRWNPQAGHKWIYDSVGRLLRRGFLRRGPCTTAPNGHGLYAVRSSTGDDA
jgi:hypothetical protein